MQVLIPITEIVENKGQIPGVPKNPREIDEMEYKALKQSLIDDPELLEYRRLLVYEHRGKYVIIGGNMRFKACKELNYKEIPCDVIRPGIDADKLRAWLIKDNVSFGAWDWDALANEWDIEELEAWNLQLPDMTAETEEDKLQDDDFDEEQALGEAAKNTVTQPGDIWLLGEHRLICADSTRTEEIARLMDGKQADAVITDPPYNVDYTGKTKDALKIENDKMSDGNFLDFLVAAYKAINDALKPGGAFYIWHADSEGYNFRKAAQEVGWKVRQCLIWNKNTMVLGRQDYQWKHEPCLYGWKEGAAHYFTADRTQVTVREEKIDIEAMTKADMKTLLKQLLEGNIPTTVIHEDKPSRSAEHPTMKPVKLIGRTIINSTRKGEIVLDVFGGSGSTLIASDQLGRICYISEFDPVYCDVIVKRWEKQTGMDATHMPARKPEESEKKGGANGKH